MRIENIIMNELEKVVRPLNIKIVELLVKENKQGLTINIVIEKEGGITIDDCEKVTRLLNDRLSILDDFDIENYRLQVSSPGLYRTFKKKEEYNIFKSRDVRIILKEPIEVSSETDKIDNMKGKRQANDLIYEGILLGIDDDIVKIQDYSNKIIEIPFNKIQKTKLNG